jgi:hypothetical protein
MTQICSAIDQRRLLLKQRRLRAGLTFEAANAARDPVRSHIRVQGFTCVARTKLVQR